MPAASSAARPIPWHAPRRCSAARRRCRADSGQPRSKGRAAEHVQGRGQACGFCAADAVVGVIGVIGVAIVAIVAAVAVVLFVLACQCDQPSANACKFVRADKAVGSCSNPLRNRLERWLVGTTIDDRSKEASTSSRSWQGRRAGWRARWRARWRVKQRTKRRPQRWTVRPVTKLKHHPTATRVFPDTIHCDDRAAEEHQRRQARN
jgi:hypothetical protein